MKIVKTISSLAIVSLISFYSDSSFAISDNCTTVYTTECEYMPDGTFQLPLVETHNSNTGYFICEETIVRNDWDWDTGGGSDTIGWPVRTTTFYTLFHVNKNLTTSCG